MKTELNVKGMHCPSCEMLICESLEDLGVDKVDISHKSGKATVFYNEHKISLASIKKVIKLEGYEVV